MNKSEQVDFLLQVLTQYDLEKYEEINAEFLQSGIDFSKIPQDKLAFAVNRFHADLNAKESNLNGVQIVTPPRYARMQSGNHTVTAREVAAEIFCHISRGFAGIYTFDKIHHTVQIILNDDRIFMVSVEKV